MVGLLGSSRLVTLTGPGGVGKTRLAIEVAANLAGRVGGGSAFVDLAAIVDPDAIVPALLHSVGIRADVGDPAAALRALGELDAVVVLDNCEHLGDAVASVVEMVTGAPGRARILATSCNRGRSRPPTAPRRSVSPRPRRRSSERPVSTTSPAGPPEVGVTTFATRQTPRSSRSPN